MNENSWKTAITDIKPNEIRLRGYRIDELMGRVDFGQAVYLLLRGELPDDRVGRLLTAMLVSSIDHGPDAPSAHAARSAASTGAPLSACVASGGVVDQPLSWGRHRRWCASAQGSRGPRDGEEVLPGRSGGSGAGRLQGP
ncbi:MAG: citrate/2-methylcitrate synthase [Planctomycetota bacterium]